VKNHHFEDDVGGVEPSAHDDLQERLAGQVLLLVLEHDAHGVQHLVLLFFVAFQDGSGELDDGVHDELDEGSFQLLARLSHLVGGPDFSLGVEVVVTPELFHHLGSVRFELVGEDLGETGQGEAPAVLAGSEGHVALLRQEEEVAHFWQVVLGNDDVDHVHHADEVLIHGLSVVLELQNLSVNLVDEKHLKLLRVL